MSGRRLLGALVLASLIAASCAAPPPRGCLGARSAEACTSLPTCKWVEDNDNGHRCETDSGIERRSEEPEECCARSTQASCFDGGCAWDWQRNSCRELACTDIYDQQTCSESSLGCAFNTNIYRCIPASEAPCSVFFSVESCPANRCTFHDWTFSCYETSKGFPCGLFFDALSCSSDGDRCTWALDEAAGIHLCRETVACAAEADPPTDAITADASTTSTTTAATTTSTAATTSTTTSTTTTTTTNAAPADECCKIGSQTSCYNAAGCAWDWQHNACREQQCIDIFDQAACGQSALGCMFSETLFRCVPSGDLPCSVFFSADLCPKDRCTFDMNTYTCYESSIGLPCGLHFDDLSCKLTEGRCTWATGDFLFPQCQQSVACPAFTTPYKKWTEPPKPTTPPTVGPTKPTEPTVGKTVEPATAEVTTAEAVTAEATASTSAATTSTVTAELGSSTTTTTTTTAEESASSASPTQSSASSTTTSGSAAATTTTEEVVLDDVVLVSKQPTTAATTTAATTTTTTVAPPEEVLDDDLVNPDTPTDAVVDDDVVNPDTPTDAVVDDDIVNPDTPTDPVVDDDLVNPDTPTDPVIDDDLVNPTDAPSKKGAFSGLGSNIAIGAVLAVLVVAAAVGSAKLVRRHQRRRAVDFVRLSPTKSGRAPLLSRQVSRVHVRASPDVHVIEIA